MRATRPGNPPAANSVAFTITYSASSSPRAHLVAQKTLAHTSFATPIPLPGPQVAALSLITGAEYLTEDLDGTRDNYLVYEGGPHVIQAVFTTAVPAGGTLMPSDVEVTIEGGAIVTSLTALGDNALQLSLHPAQAGAVTLTLSPSSVAISPPLIQPRALRFVYST